MSVRSENRWREKLRREALEIERENHTRGAIRMAAAGVYDKPRPAVVPLPPRATRREVTAWMRREVALDAEISATNLGENAAAKFDLYDGDDVIEWVWDLAAAEAIDWG